MSMPNGLVSGMTSKKPTCSTSLPATDDYKLQAMLAFQEKLIGRLGEIEGNLVELIGDKKSLPRVSPKKRVSFDLSSEIQYRNRTAESILSRQEELLKRIDQLIVDAKTCQGQVSLQSLSNQKVLDVCVVVNHGTSAGQVVRFLCWCRSHGIKILLNTHVHSTAIGTGFSRDWIDMSDDSIQRRTEYDITLTLVIKKDVEGGMRIPRDSGDIIGEEKIINYLSSVLGVQIPGPQQLYAFI